MEAGGVPRRRRRRARGAGRGWGVGRAVGEWGTARAPTIPGQMGRAKPGRPEHGSTTLRVVLHLEQNGVARNFILCHITRVLRFIGTCWIKFKTMRSLGNHIMDY
uniref:Uncharacterized protein n=1 Tax=Oryza rufipogon TaxID=4529 RepID=A0A0E0NJ71_ORYRU